MEKQSEIKKQIEYYLSDQNLSHDEFFYNKISQSNGGYLDIELIMGCNKVKKAQWTKEDIISALSSSENVEVSSDKTKIRRKDNKPLPSISLLNKKRNKDDKKTNMQSEQPIILKIFSNKSTEEKWWDIQTKFKKINPMLNVIYCRFNKSEGHFAVVPTNSNKKNKDGNQFDFTKEFELNDVIYSISLCEGEELENFNNEHGEHFDFCANKDKNKKKNKKNQTKLKYPITLGNTIYNDIGFIKSRTRKLMSSHHDMTPFNEDDSKFVLDLLKYHEDKERLLDGMEYLTCGQIDPHKYTKAFFAIGKNGKKDDFNLAKCVEKIAIKDKKKSK